MPGLLLQTHVGAVLLFVGASVAVLVIAEAAPRRTATQTSLRRLYARVFRWYDPVSISLLGVCLMTGAWMLTPIKESLGPRFFSAIGIALAIKLACAFALINLAAYVAFGICHPVVRAEQRQEPIDPDSLRSVRRRLRVAMVLTLACTAATVWAAEHVADRLAGP
ncbi:MAG: hypothetical protein D6760_00680 [Deltaproteobacteria bacterium]|nr:MAG: hypothetical protein D6760_00680 [Deltaproteobacteria bacterium]